MFLRVYFYLSILINKILAHTLTHTGGKGISPHCSPVVVYGLVISCYGYPCLLQCYIYHASTACQIGRHANYGGHKGIFCRQIGRSFLLAFYPAFIQTVAEPIQILIGSLLALALVDVVVVGNLFCGHLIVFVVTAVAAAACFLLHAAVSFSCPVYIVYIVVGSVSRTPEEIAKTHGSIVLHLGRELSVVRVFPYTAVLVLIFSLIKPGIKPFQLLIKGTELPAVDLGNCGIFNICGGAVVPSVPIPLVLCNAYGVFVILLGHNLGRIGVLGQPVLFLSLVHVPQNNIQLVEAFALVLGAVYVLPGGSKRHSRKGKNIVAVYYPLVASFTRIY